MEKEIIIAAISATIVSIISLVTAVISSVHASRSSKNLEILRQQFEASTNKRQIVDDEIINALGSLKEVLTLIQRVKDLVREILSPLMENITYSEALHKLEEINKDLIIFYEDKFPFLDKQESEQCHKLLAILQGTIATVKNSLERKNNLKKMPDSIRQLLEDCRKELTEKQNILRDFRQDRLAKLSTGRP